MSRSLRIYIALAVLIPLAVLAARIATGERVWYGWGWQMFS